MDTRRLAAAISLALAILMPFEASARSIEEFRNASSSSTSPKSPSKPLKRAASSSAPSTQEEIRACMKKAAEDRENFIMLSLTGYYNYVMKALSKRRDGVLRAWDVQDKASRKGQLSGTWREFGSTWRIANNQLKDLRTSAWRKYRLAIANCDPNAEDEEQGGSGMDSQF